MNGHNDNLPNFDVSGFAVGRSYDELHDLGDKSPLHAWLSRFFYTGVSLETDILAGDIVWLINNGHHIASIRLPRCPNHLVSRWVLLTTWSLSMGAKVVHDA